MALKQLLRPTGLEPSWSNDANLDDPAEAWDGTPTKVEPGAGKRDDGFLPDEDVPAQHVNHLLNELGKWAQLLSDVMILNWPTPVLLPSVTSNTGGACAWDDSAQQWVIGGDTDSSINIRADITADGYSFFPRDGAAVATQGGNIRYMFSKPNTDAPFTGDAVSTLVVACTDSVEVHVLVGSTWSNHSLVADDDTARCGVWDPSNQRLIIGGDDDQATNEPIFYNTVATTVSFVRVVPSFATSTSVVDMATDGLGLVLAIGDEPNGDTWTSTDGGDNWTLRTTTIDDMRSCWYNETEALWMLTNAGGEIYTSADAINWSLISTLVGSIGPRVLRGYGSLWVGCDNGNAAIFYSTDSGLTWRFTYIPQAGNNKPWDGIAFSPEYNKYLVTAFRSGAEGNINTSFAVGTPRREYTTGGGFGSPLPATVT